MKRLFILVNSQGKSLKAEDGTVRYFEKKQEVKELRDSYNGALDRIEWHVRRGPDNFKSAPPHSRPVSGLRKYQRGHHRYA